MTNSAKIVPALDRDERLAQLLADLTEQLRQGRSPDLEAAARQHPDLAVELRELWAAVLLTDGLARCDPDPQSTADYAPGAGPAECLPSSTTLPRRFGDYELLEEIGRGAMGVVYKARQHSLERTVAIKMLLRGELASGTDLARFRAEAEAAARLEHAHVVPVYEVGESAGQAYFSMKYIEGTTLARLVAAGPLPPRDAARILATISRAIDHAHRQGILHRDLKPSNVLIDRTGQPHVSDFGLAKRLPTAARPSALKGLTVSGAIVGTPSYMSPEQAAGSRGVLSPASDVYSLGAILYELLTGRPPFQAATHLDTLLLVLEQEPVAPHLLNRKVDRKLEMICLKCLQKPPELRYASAGELARDLEAYLEGEPLAIASSGLIARMSQLLSDTHHAAVLENWGLLWIWHSLVLIVLCSITNWLYLRHVDNRLPYLALWGVGMGTWASIFWALRRRGGPVTFVERQIAHVWAGSTIGSMSLFVVEWLLNLPALTLSPVLAIMAGMVFLIKAGVLSGSFYLCALACFATAIPMAIFPSIGLFLFGAVSAAGFFMHGLKYYRQSRRATPHSSGSAS
jgi:serine/threonine-protein kinase